MVGASSRLGTRRIGHDHSPQRSEEASEYALGSLTTQNLLPQAKRHKFPSFLGLPRLCQREGRWFESGLALEEI
jgi:hypothetical protein